VQEKLGPAAAAAAFPASADHGGVGPTLLELSWVTAAGARGALGRPSGGLLLLQQLPCTGSAACCSSCMDIHQCTAAAGVLGSR